MANPHNERPGKGVMYFEENKEHEKGPDFKGFIVLEMDYKAGEKVKFGVWLKETSSGFTLLALREDNWSKKQALAREEEKDTPREVQPRVVNNPFHKPKPAGNKILMADDEIPF